MRSWRGGLASALAFSAGRMSAKRVEFFFDVVSPWSYLAACQRTLQHSYPATDSLIDMFYCAVPAILQRTGATLDTKPVFLGGPASYNLHWLSL